MCDILFITSEYLIDVESHYGKETPFVTLFISSPKSNFICRSKLYSRDTLQLSWATEVRQADGSESDSATDCKITLTNGSISKEVLTK